MHSARRKNFTKRWRSAKTSGKKGRFYGIFLRILIPLLIILVGFLFVRLRTVYWNNHDKVAFAFRINSGDVGVTVADPALTELTTLIIPGDTQVDVAENYGTLRIKNVWALSQNEKLGGRLLPETVTQNFLFPTFLWSDTDGENIEKSRLSGIMKFVFSPDGTNIPFGDRVSLGLFALRVPSLGRTEINLGESQFLRKQLLNDGFSGYIINGEPSGRLTVYFSDNDLSSTGVRVNIVDATGSPGVSDKVGAIVEVLGGKVVSVEKKDPAATDCEVIGTNPRIVKKIMNLFSCKVGVGKSEFDLEFRLGSNFAKRF
jgi:hypothetical protein